MNEEMKEILDKLKDEYWYEELDLTGTKWIELKQEETNILLDYITNLQEENERLKVNCNLGYEELKVMKDYKSRIEKAIEYIENEIENMPLNGCKQRLFNIKNILNKNS